MSIFSNRKRYHNPFDFSNQRSRISLTIVILDKKNPISEIWACVISWHKLRIIFQNVFWFLYKNEASSIPRFSVIISSITWYSPIMTSRDFTPVPFGSSWPSVTRYPFYLRSFFGKSWTTQIFFLDSIKLSTLRSKKKLRASCSGLCSCSVLHSGHSQGIGPIPVKHSWQ